MKWNILELQPELQAYESDIQLRMDRLAKKKNELLPDNRKLTDFANGHHFYGLHPTKDGWVYREWAPSASALYLIGDFNGWDRMSHPLRSIGDGNWELFIPGRDTIRHLSHYKVVVHAAGTVEDRMPLYTFYTKQDPRDGSYQAQVWAPAEPFHWTDQKFRPAENIPPLIYEAHVGMSSEEGRIATFREFAENVLPRIRDNGYNTIQLMAIMEHPYYGSFGYQVSNFFAPSSRFGTPDDLRLLIDRAHGMGISVLLDLVHSHAVKNTREGINRFDGTDYQFFKEGTDGDHPAWGSKVFDYSKNGVLHFLLSNLKYWLEEFHFDGFRFDGVTSMLYRNHGLGEAFTGPELYFSLNTDVDAVTYLQLATQLVRQVKPDAVLISEDMSAMPGMCLPVADGGIGFDYRLSMGLPDFYIRMIKERADGNWDLGKLSWELQAKRNGEKRIAYAESHDQALVGDQTIMFRLAGAEMYTGMRCCDNNIYIERAMALHKLIRLVTVAIGGEGYLNFMGNEFGHPEWIDFPREGNGWSYHYSRRQWSLAEDESLHYRHLGNFDRVMVHLIRDKKILAAGAPHQLLHSDSDQLMVFERGSLIFLFNFHPDRSQPELQLTGLKPGCYRVVLSSDDWDFGGQGRISKEYVYHTKNRSLALYLPARTAAILKRVRPDGK